MEEEEEDILDLKFCEECLISEPFINLVMADGEPTGKCLICGKYII